MTNRSVIDRQRYGVVLFCASLCFVLRITDAAGQAPGVVPAPEMSATVNGGSFRALQFSPDGSKIWTNRLESWSVATGQLVDPSPDQSPKRSFEFDYSSQRKLMLAVKQGTDSALIWEQGQQTRARTLPVEGTARGVRLVEMGKRFVVVFSRPPQVCIGKVDSSEDDQVISLPFDFFRAAISPSGNLLAVSSDGDVALFEGQRARQRRILRHDANVFSVAISPDEQLVATGANDNIVRLFDSRSGELKAQWKGHGRGEIFLPSAVYALAFSPDGKRVASGGHDGRVIVWDVKTGKALLKAEISSQPIVHSVVFSPDSQLVAGGFTGVGHKEGMFVWRVPSMPSSDSARK